MSPLEAMAVEALKAALVRGSEAAVAQILEEVFAALPIDKLATVIAIATRVRERRKVHVGGTVGYGG
jgi:hypothetical protein